MQMFVQNRGALIHLPNALHEIARMYTRMLLFVAVIRWTHGVTGIRRNYETETAHKSIGDRESNNMHVRELDAKVSRSCAFHDTRNVTL